jgi:hypothetical protein
LLYLTMAQSQAMPQGNNPGNNGETNPLAAVIEAAEAGDPSAQLHMAEHFSQIREREVEDGAEGQVPGSQSASVSAYMWYLLAEKMALPMLAQIEMGKENIRPAMSPEQLTEAESRAAAWIRQRREMEASGQSKMHAGAR